MITYTLNGKSKETLGALLRALREQLGETQEQFAQRVGLARRTIAVLEAGKGEANNPRLSTIERIATGAGCSFSVDLVGDLAPSSETPMIEAPVDDETSAKTIEYCQNCGRRDQLICTITNQPIFDCVQTCKLAGWRTRAPHSYQQDHIVNRFRAEQAIKHDLQDLDNIDPF